MKYPILYRVVFYSAFLLVSGALLLCLQLMNYAPYTSNDMRIAYVAGCQLASRPLMSSDIEKCSISGDIFQDNLQHISDQMDQILEK